MVTPFLGNENTIWVGTTSTLTAAVGGHMDGDWTRSRARHDSTSNDDGNNDKHKTGHGNRSYTFKFFTDRSDGGQNILRTAEADGSMIYAGVRERGDGTTKPQDLFECSVELKPSTPMRGLAVTSCTLYVSGAINATAQA